MKKPVYLETVEYAMLEDIAKKSQLETRASPQESDSRDLWKAKAITKTTVESPGSSRRSDF